MNKYSNNKDKKEKCYVLDMFPYPSGDGLHVGHPKGYIATDIYSRFKKMQGYDVIHPMGWDAFGLPAEQHAIKNKTNPKIQTEKNINNFKAQLEKINLDYDWDRELSTTDPKFYKWTQWIFKQLYKKGLAYESNEPINWCPSCKTGLANEDLEGNACERCGSVIEKKPLRQWNLKITNYADRLIGDLDSLTAWPEWVKTAQKNWIGKSEGSEIDFEVVGGKNNNTQDKLKVFTTRADTLFGCTFMAISHTVASEWIKNGWKASGDVKNFILELQEEEKIRTIDFDINKLEKKGIDTGAKAINPANQKEVPIYIANYVLSSYGTGAVMAVPAHDERDKEFAEKYNLEILNIEEKNTDEERKNITEKVGGKLVSKYKLKDWVFARQRYWGEPFPIVYETKINEVSGESVRDFDKSPIMVADSELPVLLPAVESYEPTGTGESPLANIESFTDVYGYINDEGEFISCDKDAEKAKLFQRETNTMPQWAGSSWYYLRFLDNNNDNFLISPDIEKEWQHKMISENIEKESMAEVKSESATVDVYVGGDHATRHLIYARFWHKFLYDIGVVTTLEPFGRLEFLGFILAEDGSKMSKSKGNTINPNDIIDEYGSDTFRMYEMFMAPFEATAVWNTNSIKGVKRFIERVEKLKEKINSDTNIGSTNQNIIHQTIKKVSEDIESFKFNTCVSQFMITINEFEERGVSAEEYKNFLLILRPFAPTLCDKILKEMGVDYIWPSYDESKLQANTVKIALQINGKLRDTFDMSLNASDDEVKSKAEKSEAYKKYILDARDESGNSVEIKKTIVIKNKIVNIVI